MKERLKQLMTDHSLTEAMVADALHVSPSTIQSWLKPDTSKSARNVPAMAIELLEIKLGNIRPTVIAS